MAEMEKVEFEFPDEKEAKAQEEKVDINSPDFEIEIEDDTPPEDLS